MTIKKIKTVARPAPGGGASVQGAEGATGGATIAERFKLDTSGGKRAAGSVSRKAAMFALIAGGLALAVTGILTFLLYDHWEFLMPM